MEKYHYDPNRLQPNFYQQNRDIFSQLENYGVSVGTCGYILGISDTEIWKFEHGVKKLPPHFKRKLQKFLDKLEQSTAY